MSNSKSIRPPPAGRTAQGAWPAGRRLQLSVLCMVAIGIAIWAYWGSGRGIGWIRWLCIATAAVAGVAWPSKRLLPGRFNALRHPTRRALNYTTIAIALLSTLYLITTAINQDRDLFPKTHDDCSYAIGMQILAKGRLWMQPHPLAEFFDSFYLLVQPVYCSLYFPGAALLYSPTAWLHLPWCAMPAIAGGAVIAMMYRLTTELIDGVAGLLAALLSISLSWFRVYSVLLTSHIPMLLLGLLMLWAWLRWREARRFRWAAMLGALAGWAAITRPADALIYALPIGISMLAALARSGSWRRSLATPVVIAAAAMPFLALQVVFNRGVTGSALHSPYGYYLERDQPGSAYGFHPVDPAAKPLSTLPEKQDYYQHWVRPRLAVHRLGNVARLWGSQFLPSIIDVTMPCRALLVLMCIGLPSLAGRRLWVVGATAPLFVIIYALNPFFLEHYAILIIPAAVLSVLAGARRLARAWPRFEGRLLAGCYTMLFVACLTSLWEVNRWITDPQNRVSDETFRSPYLRLADRDLGQIVNERAVVLFTYHPGGDFIQEPVYNTDVAWPDDAPIIRAHDLGPLRNRQIFAYYAAIQPDRVFYIFDKDRGEDFLHRLGTARTLAAAPP